ncbi:MAG TPA: hypothetical protein VNY83_05845 [Solirubrobacterales bacterium]|jgi:hypothetical protein|nr:hypothetical protein [Solirubrobacterales bacterium]
MAHAVKVTDAEIEKRLKAIKFARGSLAHLTPPGVSLADELVAERRAESRREGHETEEEAQRRRSGG